MKDYHDKIWQTFITKHLFSMGRSLLIMDSAPVHISEEIKNLYLSNNKRLLFIPPGLTSVLQPLDLSINKLFKEGIRYKYAEYLIKNKDTSNKVNREDIIKWISDVWYSDKIISKISIINTFKACGISNNIYKNDDYFVTSLIRAKALMNNKESNEIIDEGEEIYINDPSEELLENISLNNDCLNEDFDC